ncbi:hypothetical protein SOVF_026020 isoform A [Spinacia oleracea]|nr:hypothetical protein SOVF_026020 isoform A [Spinacia oleracea]
MPHHFNATNTTSSSMHLQELPANCYALEFQEPFEGFAEFEDKASAADSSHNHRQAEKRRRDRINGQLARLRRLIPKSEKMDKAALLERVVEQVKDLKRKASEISKIFTIPSEIDDITIECHRKENHPNNNNNNNNNNNSNSNIMFMKATLCCEDRPDLIPELIRELKDLNLTVIGADIGCLGGRMKSILLLYYKLDSNNDGVVCNVSAIKQSLMGVLTRIISWSSASTSSFRVTSKRQRFFFSS